MKTLLETIINRIYCSCC